MIYVPETDYIGTEAAIQNYDPSFGFIAKQAFRLGLRDTTIGLAISMEAMAEAEKEGRISKEEYEQSKFFDPDIKYDDSFTYAKARLLKERMNQERLYEYYLQQMSGLDYAAGFVGLIGGSVPDPINFIPMLGTMSKANRALEFAGVSSRVMRRGILGAADAGIASALVSPLLMAERGTYQQKYDVQDALIDIGLATGIGFGFGSLLGRIKPEDSFPPKMATIEEVKQYAPEISDQLDNMLPEDRLYANRMMDFIEGVSPDMRARAIFKAMSQVGRNEPINVNAEMQPVLNPSRVQKARVMSSYYNEPPTRRFTGDALQAVEAQTPVQKAIEPDYTVTRTEDPISLIDDVIEAVEKQTDDELDTGIRELETQNLLPEEDARELVRLEDLTTEQANREIEEYYGNLAYCVMRNG